MSDDTDQPAARIIEAFGGIRPMATKLKVPVSTVQGWKQRDTIPAGRMATVRAVALAAGIDFTVGAETNEYNVLERKPASPVPPAELSGDAAGNRLETSRSSAPSDEPAAVVRSTDGRQKRGGGMALLALVIAVGVGGWVWWSSAGPGSSGAQNARLSLLEGRIARLSDEPRDLGVNTVALDELSRDVIALRTRLAEMSSLGLDSAVASLHQEVGSIRDALAAYSMAMTVGDATDPELFARLDSFQVQIQNASTNIQTMSSALLEFDVRLKALTENQANTEAAIQTRIAALEAGRGGQQVAVSRASALALVAGQLRAALESGAPFSQQLAITDSLKDGNVELAMALDTLQAVADAGVATKPTLELSFARLIPDLLAAGRQPQSNDLVDRLTSKINDIVTVRRTGFDVLGDNIEARIARAEIFLVDNDVRSAVAELAPVTGEAGILLAPWLKSARGHLDARDALAKIENLALKSLRAEDGP